MENVGILGFGWLGQRLAQSINKDYSIWATSRRVDKLQGVRPIVIDFMQKDNPIQAPAADWIVVATTFPRENIDLFLSGIQSFIGNYSGAITLCSTTGIYPNEPKMYTEEHTVSLNPFWQKIEKFFQEHYPQGNILRLGGIMGDDRYLGKYYQNKPTPESGASVNHVYYEDIIGVMKLLKERGIVGETLNVVAPQHPSKAEIIAVQLQRKEEGEQIERIISCEKLIKKIGYTFVYPNPIEFPFIRML